jgi:hypothetical protein
VFQPSLIKSLIELLLAGLATSNITCEGSSKAIPSQIKSFFCQFGGRSHSRKNVMHITHTKTD